MSQRESNDQRRARLLALVCAGAAPATVGDLCARWLSHCRQTYLDRAGSSTFTNARDALREVAALFGNQSLNCIGADFAQAIQLALVESKLSRRTINDRLGRIRQMTRWAHSNSWITSEQCDRCCGVRGLRRGRKLHGLAPEESIEKPLPPLHAILRTLDAPGLRPALKAMVKVQLLTGMRPGEVTELRGCDIDISRSNWIYKPPAHKTQHLEKHRAVGIGPRAQLILIPMMRDDYIFLSRFGKPYTVHGYHQNIIKACDKMNVPRWTPKELRKVCGTDAAVIAGPYVAQAVLGHSSVRTTERHYISPVERPDVKEYLASHG